MATNLKGQSGIKGILLLHGEKVAIFVVAVVALWIVYKSSSVPRLTDSFQAVKLKSEISQTSNQIQQLTWSSAIDQFPEKVKKSEPIAAKNNLTVKADDYINEDGAGKREFAVDRAIVAPMIRRVDPTLLNAVDVWATGNSGLIPFIDEKIKNERAIKRATEEAQRAKLDADRQKREEQKSQRDREGGAPGGRARGEGPGAGYATDVFDPAYPKRRPVQSSFQPAGIPLQGDERVERAYWACVVAKVPIREQLKLHQDAFEKARGYDPMRDFPSYLGFFVERAEVLPGKELEWKSVPLYDGQQKSIAQNAPLTKAAKHVVGKTVIDALYSAAQQFWAGGISPDVVDARYVEYALTLPLPPLVGRDWGPEAIHPDIPLNPPPLEEETQQPLAQTTEQQPGETDVNSPFGTGNLGQPGPGPFNSPGPSRFPGGPGMRFQGQGEFHRGPGPGPGPSRFMGERGPEGFRGGGPGQVAGQHTSLPKGVDYYLLRFLDFSVEPGKKYKYRVKLVLADPNYGLPASVLAPAVLDRQTKEAKAHSNQKLSYRLIESWSDPSPTVGIPLAGSVRLAEAAIPERFNDEPSITLFVESFDVDDKGNAIQAATEKKNFRRGYVANMVEDAEYLGDGGQWIDTQPNFKFLTGMTVLDVDGGTKLTKDMTVPSRILLMGPGGELYIRNEIDDKPLVEYHRLLFEKPDKRQGTGEGELGPGPGGRMPMRSPRGPS